MPTAQTPVATRPARPARPARPTGQHGQHGQQASTASDGVTFRIPALSATVERRLLINYRLDPAVAHTLLRAN